MVKREEIRAMQDAWRAYLDLALGYTDASRKQAGKAVRRLVGQGGATAEQLQSMAEDLVNTSLANREALARLIRFELDRVLGRVGLATADEVSELTARVRELEQKLAVAAPPPVPAPPLTAPGAAEPAAPPTPEVTPVPAKKIAAKKVAKKATMAEPAPPPTPTPAAVKVAPVKAKKTMAKKAVAKKAGAKKAAAS